ncbi:MAG: glycosyltransferase family 2 protein [Thermoguttaceae bacterium]
MTLLEVVNLVLLAAVGVLLLPIAVFAGECLAAILPRGAGPNRKRGIAYESPSLALRASAERATPRTAVLVPAHDEQAGIERTVRAILATLSAGDRLLVVADNCTDQTASLARQAGAEVVERTNPDRRGKGYALQCGIQALATDPPDALIIIDADCRVEPETIEVLARRAVAAQRPVQARNLTEVDPWRGRARATSLEAVSVLANRFTNLIRPLGLARLAAPCRLTGTGMAFPWSLAAEMQLAGGNLVEDMQLGIDLAMQGCLAVYCAEVGVTSGLPAAGRAFVAQRTRWEQGHLRTAARQVPRLLAFGLRRRSWPLLAMAADLSIPPLALLIVLWLAVTLASGVAWAVGGSPLPLLLAAVGGLSLAVSLGLGWAMFCRRHVPLPSLAAVPFYLLRKLPIYARMLVRRQDAWVRTDRSVAPSPHARRRSPADRQAAQR